MARVSPAAALIRRPVFWVVLVIVLILIGVRAALPGVVTDYANHKLSDIPGYEARIEDVDLHLWRGGYTIYGTTIEQINRKRRIPVLSAPRVEFSLEWRELLRGALVGQIEFHEPSINLLAGPVKKDEARAADDIVHKFRELLPVRVNRFAIVGGDLHFRNYAAEPDIDLYLDDITLVARNLTNSARISDTLVATVAADGRAMQSGRFELHMRLDPFAPVPTFDLAFELKTLRLPELNRYLRHYLAVEARDGRLSVFAEAKAEKGRFRGYVRPFVQDLDVLELKENKSVGEAIKGFFVKLVANVFENKPEEQLATKIEFSGKFENPETSVWEAVTTFMRNAFVQALQPGLEGSVAPGRAKQVKEGAPPGEGREEKEERRTEEEKEELKEKR